MRLSVLSRLGTFAVVLAFMGCAVQAQKHAQHIESQLKYAINQNELCQAWLQKHDVYQRLETILIFTADDKHAANKMRIDRNAMESEKEDMLRLNNLTAVCRKDNLENFGRVHPDFVVLLANWYSENDALILELLRDEVTIGEANKVANKRMAGRQIQSDAAGAKITQQLKTSDQIEKADRQRVAAAMRQWNYQQQLLLQNQQMTDSTKSLTITNCSYEGDSFNCTNY